MTYQVTQLPVSIFEDLFESSPLAFAVIEVTKANLTNPRIVSCNRVFSSLFRIRNKSGQFLKLLSPFIELEKLYRYLSKPSLKSYSLESRIFDSDADDDSSQGAGGSAGGAQSQDVFVLNATPYAVNENTIYYLVTIRALPVSPSILPDEILDAESSSSWQSHAQRNSLAKARLISNLNHDLRTPLNAILGFSEIMQQETFGKISNQKYKSYLDDIVDSCHGLLNTVENLLEYANLDNDGVENLASLDPNDPAVVADEALHISMIRADKLIEDTIHHFSTQLNKRGISHNISVGNIANFAIIGDKTKLEHCYASVMNRIMKNSSDNSQLNVSSKFRGDQLEIKFEVSAIQNMQQERYAPNVLPFARNRYALDPASEEFCLALLLANRYLEMHGGNLELQVSANRSTSIITYIPIERVSKMPEMAHELTS
jgi:signal transduction histidine kinase